MKHTDGTGSGYHMMALFEGIIELLQKFVKWLGVFGILKICLLIFGIGFLAFIIHFGFIVVAQLWDAGWNVWVNRGTVFSTH